MKNIYVTINRSNESKLNQSRKFLKKFINEKLQIVILGGILINTLSMALEHHDQVNIKT